MHQPFKKNLNFNKITPADILNIINNLKNKNSCGHDGISTKMLNYIAQEICEPLATITNKCITTGKFPDILKIAKVKPFLKK